MIQGAGAAILIEARKHGEAFRMVIDNDQQRALIATARGESLIDLGNGGLQRRVIGTELVAGMIHSAEIQGHQPRSLLRRGLGNPVTPQPLLRAQRPFVLTPQAFVPQQLSLFGPQPKHLCNPESK